VSQDPNVPYQSLSLSMFCCQVEKEPAKKEEVVTEQPKEGPTVNVTNVANVVPNEAPKETISPSETIEVETENVPSQGNIVQEWIQRVWGYEGSSLLPEKCPSHRVLLCPQAPESATCPVEAEYLYHAIALVPAADYTGLTPSMETCPLSIKVKNTLGSYRFFSEATPLHLACFIGNMEYATFLLQFPVDIQQVCVTWSETMEAERKWSVMDCAIASGNVLLEDLIRDSTRAS
jgi:ankyrin repeat protein